MPAKIATSEELQTELRTLWAMTEEENPSRGKLAAAISDLASKVAGIDRVDGPMIDHLLQESIEVSDFAENSVSFHNKTKARLTALKKTFAEREEPESPTSHVRAAYFRRLERAT
jgi:hypothetical protein